MTGSDFNIDIGINTKQLERVKKDFQNMFSGEFGGGGNNQGKKEAQGINVVSKGFTKALKFTGIIGIISSLSLIADVITIVVGLIAALAISGIIAFFKDPVRALLGLGVFIANQIISGLEFLANAIVPGADPFEFPRFQTSLVFQAYDDLQGELATAAEDGKTTFGEASAAYQTFGKKLIDSFVTNTRFTELAIEAQRTNQTIAEVAFRETDSLFDFIGTSATAAGDIASRAFGAVRDMFSRIENQANSTSGGSAPANAIGSHQDGGYILSTPTTASYERITDGASLLRRLNNN